MCHFLFTQEASYDNFSPVRFKFTKQSIIILGTFRTVYNNLNLGVYTPLTSATSSQSEKPYSYTERAGDNGAILSTAIMYPR